MAIAEFSVTPTLEFLALLWAQKRHQRRYQTATNTWWITFILCSWSTFLTFLALEGMSHTPATELRHFCSQNTVLAERTSCSSVLGVSDPEIPKEMRYNYSWNPNVITGVPVVIFMVTQHVAWFPGSIFCLKLIWGVGTHQLKWWLALHDAMWSRSP